MKKIFSILVLVLMSSACFAQTIIEMEKEGGVYHVPCKVNGVSMKFIFDSGAASVCISESMANYLYENGYITLNDIIGLGKSRVADGRIVENIRINLRDIEIAGMHLHNIEGLVILGLEGPLLLGQSAIQALGRVSIDGNRLIIHNSSQSLSQEQIEYLRTESAKLFEAGDYRAALTHLRKLYNSDVCDFVDMYAYADCLSRDNQYEEALVVTQKWFKSYEEDAPAWMRYHLYARQALNYYYKTVPDYKETINWAERQIMLTPIVFEEERVKDDELFLAYRLTGEAYFKLEQYGRSLEKNEKAFNLRMSYFDCKTPKDAKKIKDEKLGNCAFAMAKCYYQVKDYSNFSKSLAIAARLGCRPAIAQCKNLNIKY